MNKQELIDVVAASAGVSKSGAGRAVQAVLDVIHRDREPRRGDATHRLRRTSQGIYASQTESQACYG